MSNSVAIICTRNRPGPLRHTLQTLQAQEGALLPRVYVIDASDAPAFNENAQTVSTLSLDIVHHRHTGRPSAARQRNAGLDVMPNDTEFVFFFDDDITICEGCLQHLTHTLRTNAAVCGAGAIEKVDAPGRAASSPPLNWNRLFLLDSPRPGRVLLSGHTSAYDIGEADGERLVPTQWLNTGCTAYRAEAIRTVRFDTSVEGASLEDLDFSYRVGQTGRLVGVPRAQFLHHAPTSRYTSVDYRARKLVDRFWFLEKNIEHPLRYPAFWWAALGQLLALLASSKDGKHNALRGHLRGIRTILTRSHPALQ